MREHRAFDDAFQRAAETRPMEARDRAFARVVAATTLRRHGELQTVLGSFLQKKLPEGQGRLDAILLAASAQLLFLETPPHAVISLAVDQCHGDRSAERFAKLANAVLRRVSGEGRELIQSAGGAAVNIPAWLMTRWKKEYGETAAIDIAKASLCEPALDMTVKSDAAAWAEKLGATLLPTGSIRLANAGRIEDLSGFDEGAWWVQDAAAALPARLLTDIAGWEVLDMCAAPGGKAAQLASAGARVTALDKSVGRLKRLTANLQRLGLTAETVVGDAVTFDPGKAFDAILIDAPCTSTGTIRRHPDILHLKREEDVPALAALQSRILQRAAALLKPGGTLVYCTCSLEPEEGRQQIAAFLGDHPEFARRPVDAADLGLEAGAVSAEGDVRTLPSQMAGLPKDLRGCDGFFATRLQKRA